eukprot:1150997-Pelagomonas_calceolata.AAC.5
MEQKLGCLNLLRAVSCTSLNPLSAWTQQICLVYSARWPCIIRWTTHAGIVSSTSLTKEVRQQFDPAQFNKLSACTFACRQGQGDGSTTGSNCWRARRPSPSRGFKFDGWHSSIWPALHENQLCQISKVDDNTHMHAKVDADEEGQGLKNSEPGRERGKRQSWTTSPQKTGVFNMLIAQGAPDRGLLY